MTTMYTQVKTTMATAQTVDIPVGESSVIAISVRGTFVGTLQFEATIDGVNYYAAPAVPATSTGQVAAVTSTTAVGDWLAATVGAVAFRVRFSAYTSGGAVVTLRATNEVFPFSFSANGTTQAVSGNITATPSATTGGFTTTHHLISAATTNATSVKASSGTIGSIVVCNSSAAVKYFKVYNKASAPTVGTDTPVLTLQVPAGGTVVVPFEQGLRLGTGIAYATTTGIAVSDTTAVALNDLSIFIDYI